MPGIRLHPNYHGYTLADTEFSEVLQLASDAGLIVQLAVRMEDERTQHPLMMVPPVSLKPLAGVVKNVPSSRLVVLNSARDPLAKQIAAAGNVCFDFAMIERVRGVAQLASDVSLERVVFGSHFPLFYFQSAALKVREATLSAADEKAVLEDNARRLRKS